MRKLAFFVLTLSLFTQAQAKTLVLDRIEATVNASIILHSDVLDFRRTLELRSQLDPLFQNHKLSRRDQKASEKDIVEFLIQEKLILGEFPATDAEVEQEINSIQANNRIDRRSLKTAIEAQGFTFNDYFELIRVSISKRNLIDRDIRTKVHISEDDIRNTFYNDKRKASTTTLSYHIRLISISPKNYKSPSAALDTAKRALQQVRGGETFEEVAKRLSDDPSAPQGGDLGTLTLDEMAPALRSQVKEMQLGQVSEVFGSEQTQFFILKLADIKSNQDNELNKAKEQIRASLTAKEFQHQIELWLEKQVQQSFVHYAGAPLLAAVPGANVKKP